MLLTPEQIQQAIKDAHQKRPGVIFASQGNLRSYSPSSAPARRGLVGEIRRYISRQSRSPNYPQKTLAIFQRSRAALGVSVSVG
jgi:hypothetical protein